MESPENDIFLEDDQQLYSDQLHEEYPAETKRNPRIVGPDDFHWWLLLEQQEQL